MAKETRLSDSANIYSRRRQTKTEKQKLSEMTFREKLHYFNDYYRNRSIVIVIAAIAVISILHTIFSPKPEIALYAAVVNDYLEEDASKALSNDFFQKAGFKKNKQEVVIDTGYNMLGGTSSATMASEQKFTTYLFANTIDVVITDEAQFSTYAKAGYFTNLADELPTDVYSKLSDSFYLANESESNQMKAFGIYLDKSQVYKKTGTIIEKPVIGIVAGSKQKENAVTFIEYLFQLHP